MINYTMKVQGLDSLIKDFEKAPELITRELTLASSKAGKFVQVRAKSESPVRTGYLRGSVMLDVSAFKTTIYPIADYAIFVEGGTRKMAANPFMERTYFGTLDTVERYFQAVVDKITKQLAGK